MGLAPTDDPDELNTIYAALHHQFVASAKAVKLAHEICPDYMVGCMIGGGPSIYPYTCAPADVLGAQKKLQIGTWLCSDVQCRGAYPGYAKRFFADNGITIPLSAVKGVGERAVAEIVAVEHGDRIGEVC